MYVCMYIYIYIYIYVCVCVCVCVQISLSLSLSLSLHIYIYICMYLYIYIYIYIIAQLSSRSHKSHGELTVISPIVFQKNLFLFYLFFFCVFEQYLARGVNIKVRFEIQGIFESIVGKIIVTSPYK